MAATADYLVSFCLYRDLTDDGLRGEDFVDAFPTLAKAKAAAKKDSVRQHFIFKATRHAVSRFARKRVETVLVAEV